MLILPLQLFKGCVKDEGARVTIGNGSIREALFLELQLSNNLSPEALRSHLKGFIRLGDP